MNKKNSEMNFVFSLDDINIILTDETHLIKQDIDIINVK